MTVRQEQAWLTLLDLHEQIPTGWPLGRWSDGVPVVRRTRSRGLAAPNGWAA